MGGKPVDVAISTIHRLIEEKNIKELSKSLIRTVGRVSEASEDVRFGKYAILVGERSGKEIMVLFDDQAVDKDRRPYILGLAEVVGKLEFRKILKEDKWVIIAKSIRAV